MWFRVAEDMHLRVDDVVGFFGPDVLIAAKGGKGGTGAKGDDNPRDPAGQAQGPGKTDRTARAFALMRDGSVAQTPFGVRALAGRYKKALDELKTITTGE